MGQGKLVIVLVQLTFMKQLITLITVITIMQKLTYMILKFILDNQLGNASIFCPISLK